MVYTRCMSRDDIKSLMLKSGFRFEKTTLSYPARRGDEDIYTRHPEYKYTFRVSRVDESSQNYGLYAGVGEQFQKINAIVAYDVDVAEVWKSSKPLPMWSGDNLRRLLQYFGADTDNERSGNKDKADEIVTVILPIVNGG